MIYKIEQATKNDAAVSEEDIVRQVIKLQVKDAGNHTFKA